MIHKHLTSSALARRESASSPPSAVLHLTSSYQRQGLYAPPNSNEIHSCTNYGIASIFTPPRNRGKGYAAHMMHLLHWALAPEAALASSLFPSEWGNPPPRPQSPSNTGFSVL